MEITIKFDKNICIFFVPPSLTAVRPFCGICWPLGHQPEHSLKKAPYDIRIVIIPLLALVI